MGFLIFHVFVAVTEFLNGASIVHIIFNSTSKIKPAISFGQRLIYKPSDFFKGKYLKMYLIQSSALNILAIVLHVIFLGQMVVQCAIFIGAVLLNAVVFFALLHFSSKIYRQELLDRLQTIPDFLQKDDEELRRLLLEKYDCVYELKSIRMAIKKTTKNL